MKISTHIKAAANDFVAYVLGELPDGSEFRSQDHVKDSGNKQRAHIYQILVHAGYRDDVDADIEDKLKARGLTHCHALVPTLHTNFSLLPPKLPPHYRTVQFDLIMNALMTDRRTRHFDGSGDAERKVGPCHVCGKGEDSQQHLFGGECEPVCKARAALARSVSMRRNRLTASKTGASPTIATSSPVTAPPAPTRETSIQGQVSEHECVTKERFEKMIQEHEDIDMNDEPIENETNEAPGRDALDETHNDHARPQNNDNNDENLTDVLRQTKQRPRGGQ